MGSDKDREKQEFNFAVSDLNRVNLICAAIEDNMMNLNCFEWFTSLHTLSATLSPYMTDEEIEEINTQLSNLWTEIEKTNKTNTRKGTQEVPSDVFIGLKTVYIKLRRIQKDSDLLGKPKGDFLEPENW